MSIDLFYFQPAPEGDDSKKKDKGLISPKQVVENASKKAQKMSNSKVKNTGLIQNEGNSKLLTDDGREIFNENK